MFLIVCRAFGPTLNFYQNFQSFSQPWSIKQKVIILGDFDIHLDIENDSLGTAFLPQLNKFGFCQCVHESTHTFNHTLDLVLIYDIEIDHLKISAQNLFIKPLFSNI